MPGMRFNARFANSVLANDQRTAGLVEETLNMLEEGRTRIHLHPKKDYVLIVGKAGTGKDSVLHSVSSQKELRPNL